MREKISWKKIITEDMNEKKNSLSLEDYNFIIPTFLHGLAENQVSKIKICPRIKEMCQIWILTLVLAKVCFY